MDRGGFSDQEGCPFLVGLEFGAHGRVYIAGQSKGGVPVRMSVSGATQ